MLVTSALQKNAVIQLQSIYNSAAQLLIKTKGGAHIMDLLKYLHWLSVRFHVGFKTLLLALHGPAPDHLSEKPLSYSLLAVPQSRTETSGDAALAAGKAFLNGEVLNILTPSNIT